MIEGFEKQTKELTDYERNILLPIMCKCFKNHQGKENAITNSLICEKMTAKGYDVSEVRVRKIINQIRTYHLVPRLMATNQGYYITDDPAELNTYLQSLIGRRNAIQEVIDAVKIQYDELRTNRKY